MQPLKKQYAVLFDLDGVLIKTEPETFQFYERHIKEQYGIIIPHDALPIKIGRKSIDFFRRILTPEQLRIIDIEKLIQYKRKMFRENITQFVRKVPGVQSILQQLQRKKFLIGVVSQNERQMVDTAIQWLAIRPYISIALSLADVQQRKPDPELYLRAAKKLRLAPSSCIAIEDSEDGVAAAKNAGMYCIGILHSYTPKGALALTDRRTRSFGTILPFIERWRDAKKNG